MTIDAIRAEVGLDAVLGAHGYTALRNGRIACPIHQGRSPNTFAVRDNERFRCFNCDAHGDVVDLEQHLGGGDLGAAISRLCERHGIRPGRADLATIRLRRNRLERLNAWWRWRLYQWTQAHVITEQAVSAWQCDDPAAADEVWWSELQARCAARDRAEAMAGTFSDLRTVEQRATAYAVEQHGVVALPWELGE